MSITAKCRDDAQSRMLGASSARPRQPHDGGGVMTPEDTELHQLQEARTGWAGGGMSLRCHPVADILPLMDGEELDRPVVDIKAHGVSEPIVTYDGMILDGRNRYRACLAAGKAPRFYGAFWAEGKKLYAVDDPATYVISANIHRRHLTAEQK